MEKMLEIVIKAFADSVRQKSEAYRAYRIEQEKRENEESTDRTVELNHKIWHESCEKYWTLHKLLEEYGFNSNQIYRMEQAAIE